MSERVTAEQCAELRRLHDAYEDAIAAYYTTDGSKDLAEKADAALENVQKAALLHLVHLLDEIERLKKKLEERK